MQLHAVADEVELAQVGAELVRRALHGLEAATFLAASGATPTGVYRKLATDPDGAWRPDRLTLAALDEYWRAPATHAASFSAYLRTHLSEPLRVPAEQLHTPNTQLPDAEACARDYAQRLAAADPVACALLGVGRNGHVAFIEPADALPLDVHVAALTQETVRANRADIRALGSHVEAPPRVRAISVGIGTILRVRRVIVLAAGPSKRETVRALVEATKVTPRSPATFLLLHPHCDLVADRSALAGWHD
jgi:glucosamine-6-phosphate deaminase